MKLTETSTLWGNMYRRRYFLDGRRISYAQATALLRDHTWEDAVCTRGTSTHHTYWNIGPRIDSRSLTDCQDIA